MNTLRHAFGGPALAAFAILALGGCTLPPEAEDEPADGGPSDVEHRDGGPMDSGLVDAAPPDARPRDAGRPEVGADADLPDAELPDADTADRGPVDMAPPTCDVVACPANARCVDEGGAAECICDPDYVAVADACRPTCAVEPCGPGRCRDGEGGAVCDCMATGFGGEWCADDVDVCAAGLHDCPADCVDGEGDFECVCPEGQQPVGDRCIACDGPLGFIGRIHTRPLTDVVHGRFLLHDVDGDGLLDLVGWGDLDDQTALGSRLPVLLQRNLGDARFADPVEVAPGGSYTRAVGVLDVDRDGRPDIARVVGERREPTLLEWYRSTPDGFAFGGAFEIEDGLYYRFGEWLEPGQRALLIQSRTRLAVWIPDGDDSRVVPVWSAHEGLDRVLTVEGGHDVDGDGLLDLIVSSSDTDPETGAQRSGVEVMRGRGEAGFVDDDLWVGMFGGSWSVGDFDGDGDPDVARYQQWSTEANNHEPPFWYENVGDGGFVEHVRPAWPYPDGAHGLGPGADFDGDGRDDIWSNAGLWSDPASAARGFSNSPYGGSGAADIDGDGHTDIVLGAARTLRVERVVGDAPLPTYGIRWLRNNGVGVLGRTSPVDAAPVAGPYNRWHVDDIVAADFDGDGLGDLAVGLYGGLRLYRNADRARFEALPAPEFATEVRLAQADVDTDGDIDLVYLTVVRNNVDRSTVGVLLNDGAAGFEPGWSIQVDGTEGGVLADDVDGDGWLDLLVLGPDGLVALLGDPDLPGHFVLGDRVDGLTVVGRPHRMRVAGGRRTTVVFGGRGDEPIRPLRIDWQDGGFGEPRPLVDGQLAEVWRGVVGDFDGDGLDDLAAHGGEEMRPIVLMADGQGGFAVHDAWREVEVYARLSQLAVADIDRDGRDDLIHAMRLYDGHAPPSGRMQWFRHVDGAFELSESVVVGWEVHRQDGLVAADLNGDGQPVLVSTGSDAVGPRLMVHQTTPYCDPSRLDGPVGDE